MPLQILLPGFPPIAAAIDIPLGKFFLTRIWDNALPLIPLRLGVEANSLQVFQPVYTVGCVLSVLRHQQIDKQVVRLFPMLFQQRRRPFYRLDLR